MSAVNTDPLWPLALYFALVVAVAAGMLALSYVLGQRRRDRALSEPYEGGIAPTGSARVRLSAQFYLVALFFVIFELEAVFIFAWAGAARELGWMGYIEMVIFVAILFATLVYLWRLGALDWGPSVRQAVRKG